jgi:hypothetical protein
MPIDEILDELPKGKVTDYEEIIYNKCTNGLFIGILNYTINDGYTDVLSIMKFVPANYLQKTGQEFVDYILNEENVISNYFNNDREDIYNVIKQRNKVGFNEIVFNYHERKELHHDHSHVGFFNTADKLEDYARERNIEGCDSKMFFVELELVR